MLTALDSDVIKTYVELGMGVGIVAQMAYDPERDSAFEKLDAAHLFAPSITRLAIRRGAFLRGYIYEFIHLFAPALDRAAVDAALVRRRKAGWPARLADDCECSLAMTRLSARAASRSRVAGVAQGAAARRDAADRSAVDQRPQDHRRGRGHARAPRDSASCTGSAFSPTTGWCSSSSGPSRRGSG